MRTLRQMIRAVALSVGLVCFAVGARAQELPSPVAGLYGNWVGEGTLFGQAAEFSMQWEQVLSGAFVRLNFHNAIITAGGADTAVAAVGYYRVAGANDIRGVWLDSRGVEQPLDGRVVGSSLVINWGTPATEQGKTVYGLTGDGRVMVVDSVLAGGQWREFATATYRRADLSRRDARD